MLKSNRLFAVGFFISTCRRNHSTRYFSANVSGESKRISRVLVANRGEIALRIIATLRKMGIESVAVFSDADANSLHTKAANYACRIGEPSPLSSYLLGERIIESALKTNVDAIHPGYGFLSEKADFAELCEANGIIFVGPPAKAIRDMGMKNKAKITMINANVPVVPGYNGNDQSPEKLFEEAKRIGFPVMMKAVFGGGGKGMRISKSETDFFENLESARSEAHKAYANTEMIIEKYVEDPRHIEVQVFGDKHGNYVSLWERDCSIQRRHQKIIEEAPAFGFTNELREKLSKNAKKAAKAVNYTGAGTVEFIMDKNGDFYFMEMNTRLQVEHPVTECITGVDLVEWQLIVAGGGLLPLKQDEIPLNGSAIEARIYAEDSDAGFMPAAGSIEYLEFPSEARVETGVREGDEVTVYYDSMIAKIIAHGKTRGEAIKKLDIALSRTYIGGLCNNVDFIRRCLKCPDFVEGKVSTKFIAENEPLLLSNEPITNKMFVEATLSKILLNQHITQVNQNDPFFSSPSFRLNHRPIWKIPLNQDINAEVTPLDNGQYLIEKTSEDTKFDALISNIKRSYSTENNLPVVDFTIELGKPSAPGNERWKCRAVKLSDKFIVYGPNGKHEWEFKSANNSYSQDTAVINKNDARSPMPGVVEKIFVAVGDLVNENQVLVTVNAMKMEFLVRAPKDCTVKSIHCSSGDSVAKNSLLISLE